MGACQCGVPRRLQGRKRSSDVQEFHGARSPSPTELGNRDRGRPQAEGEQAPPTKNQDVEDPHGDNAIGANAAVKTNSSTSHLQVSSAGESRQQILDTDRDSPKGDILFDADTELFNCWSRGNNSVEDGDGPEMEDGGGVGRFSGVDQGEPPEQEEKQEPLAGVDGSLRAASPVFSAKSRRTDGKLLQKIFAELQRQNEGVEDETDYLDLLITLVTDTVDILRPIVVVTDKERRRKQARSGGKNDEEDGMQVVSNIGDVGKEKDKKLAVAEGESGQPRARRGEERTENQNDKQSSVLSAKEITIRRQRVRDECARLYRVGCALIRMQFEVIAYLTRTLRVSEAKHKLIEMENFLANESSEIGLEPLPLPLKNTASVAVIEAVQEGVQNFYKNARNNRPSRQPGRPREASSTENENVEFSLVVCDLDDAANEPSFGGSLSSTRGAAAASEQNVFNPDDFLIPAPAANALGQHAISERSQATPPPIPTGKSATSLRSNTNASSRGESDQDSMVPGQQGMLTRRRRQISRSQNIAKSHVIVEDVLSSPGAMTPLHSGGTPSREVTTGGFSDVPSTEVSELQGGGPLLQEVMRGANVELLNQIQLEEEVEDGEPDFLVGGGFLGGRRRGGARINANRPVSTPPSGGSGNGTQEQEAPGAVPYWTSSASAVPTRAQKYAILGAVLSNSALAREYVEDRRTQIVSQLSKYFRHLQGTSAVRQMCDSMAYTLSCVESALTQLYAEKRATDFVPFSYSMLDPVYRVPMTFDVRINYARDKVTAYFDVSPVPLPISQVASIVHEIDLMQPLWPFMESATTVKEWTLSDRLYKTRFSLPLPAMLKNCSEQYHHRCMGDFLHLDAMNSVLEIKRMHYKLSTMKNGEKIPDEQHFEPGLVLFEYSPRPHPQVAKEVYENNASFQWRGDTEIPGLSETERRRIVRNYIDRLLMIGTPMKVVNPKYDPADGTQGPLLLDAMHARGMVEIDWTSWLRRLTPNTLVRYIARTACTTFVNRIMKLHRNFVKSENQQRILADPERSYLFEKLEERCEEYCRKEYKRLIHWAHEQERKRARSRSRSH
ncbi:unnamed protein product [Amoebophrya sp. A25]|nr:unnamed protein product [Amoebophrya sp. A25]|eukprot:GSA25T00025085001.1